MSGRKQIQHWSYQASRGLPRVVSQVLNTWQEAACTLLQESWNTLLGQGVQLTRSGTDQLPAHKALRELPDPGFGAQLMIGPEGVPTLIAASASLVMALVNDLLGVTGNDRSAPETVTPAEMSMIELLFGEVSRAAAQGWPAVETLECQLHSIVNRPLRTRLFSPEQMVVRARWQVEIADEVEPIMWIIPAEELQGLLGQLPSTDQESAIQAAPELRAIAEQIRVQLVVELGRARLTLGELQGLAPGDVVVLDQSAQSWLRGVVGGQTRCLGTPCRIGNRQAFQVQSLVES